MELRVKRLSAMTKVFLDEEPGEDFRPGEVFLNEAFCFQLAFCPSEALTLEDETLTVCCTGGGAVTAFLVGQVPCELPCYPDADDDYLRRRPGLFPDPLYPVTGPFRLTGMLQWRALFFEVDAGALGAGEHELEVRLETGGGLCARAVFGLRVLPLALPPQRLVFTQWIHYDCIARLHGQPCMGPQHWEMVWRYVRQAAEHGVNMLLTPLVTPPLDTLPGRERPTVQLIDVEVENGEYRFGFERLRAFMETARGLGIEYFEMTPLFTQWGAAFAPKVVARVAGEARRIFGWDSPSDGVEYTRFLRELLPRLGAELRAWGLAERCFFHVSDEPQKPEHYPHYRKAYTLMAEHLKGFAILDTLSSAEFYKEGYIRHPIAAADAFARLRAAGAEEMWAYYCCAQYKKTPNHFLAMPLRRTRVLGSILYRQNVGGFLHWGYNFWNGKYSECELNPYCDTDGKATFPGGDPFVVYPGEAGPLSSLRQKALRQAVYDNRALQLLEERAGRAAVLALLEAFGPLDFEEYPRSDEALHRLRAGVNRAIMGS